MCRGKYYLIFSGIIFIGDIVLALLSLVVAFKTKKHLPADKKYRKYHESAVINLTTLMAVILSSICEAVLIIFQLNNIRNGALLIITLRECLWLYPISFLLFIPKVMKHVAVFHAHYTHTTQTRSKWKHVCIYLSSLRCTEYIVESYNLINEHYWHNEFPY